MTEPMTIDLDRLLKLRLVVARYGEMDGAGWWNTNGVLGRRGGLLMSRGFPKTRHFAQARLVFEVARSRCTQRFSIVPGAITLWNLPAQLEEEFDARWAHWIRESESWAEFFDSLEGCSGDLLAMLREHALVDSEQENEVARMRRSAEGRSVPLAGTRKVDDETITLLAASFSRGEKGKPAIPYAVVESL